jgi:ribonuclease HI
MKFKIISDGACSGNPGPGGYGAIVATEFEIQEFGGAEKETTNNRMEMMGFLVALEAVLKSLSSSTGHEASSVVAILDSSYVLNGAKSYIWNWSRNADANGVWKTQSLEPVKNQDLWQKILNVLKGLKSKSCAIEYLWVRGHTGHSANERVDQIAVSYSRWIQGASGVTEKLFQGSPSDYFKELNVDVHALFEVEALPSNAVKKKSSDSSAIFYLAWVDRKLLRFKTWPECEAVVKGRGGVKYKKISSPEEEIKTLKLWGVK